MIDPSQREKILANFNCQKSGNCCRAPGYVYVTAEDIRKMAAHLGMGEDAFREQNVRKIEGWEVIASPDFRPRCFLTEENTCSVYELRPLACRTYPQWPQIWESEESLREETEKCPGLRRALALVKKQK